MKIKALRTIVGSYGRVVTGAVADLRDDIGQQLVKAGLAIEADKQQVSPAPPADAKSAPMPDNKAAAAADNKAKAKTDAK